MDVTDSEVLQMFSCIYATLAGNTILIYDHMTTLPEEIAFIWCRPKALSAVLFLLNRYVALFANICGLVMDFLPVSDEVQGSTLLSCLSLLLNEDLVVRNTRCTDNWSFSAKQSSFVVSGFHFEKLLH
ncbi:hypothetical protein DFJ58DRAFT_780344 [Suillus subalutaceus]|uniref:uncharacterized protein n=1 Tax=Suillus subalutaceus TaxID=48586 RepID=UPI001B878C11|nr:uncharacterized protein DFJ58DRAFT_780344 [Suillus subalutaceus]KAG1859593.1 hypothetical protein DFJ58DRAFT_780344 [Suillus subalutaceus]